MVPSAMMAPSTPAILEATRRTVYARWRNNHPPGGCVATAPKPGKPLGALFLATTAEASADLRHAAMTQTFSKLVLDWMDSAVIPL